MLFETSPCMHFLTLCMDGELQNHTCNLALLSVLSSSMPYWPLPLPELCDSKFLLSPQQKLLGKEIKSVALVVIELYLCEDIIGSK